MKKSFMCDTIYKEKQEKKFSEFKSVASVGDTTIFPIFKPYSVFAEAKEYFSWKHNIYGIKIDTSHLPTDQLCGYGKIKPGAGSFLIIKY